MAREILMMEPVDYANAFKGSAIKRAKLWMLEGGGEYARQRLEDA